RQAGARFSILPRLVEAAFCRGEGPQRVRMLHHAVSPSRRRTHHPLPGPGSAIARALTHDRKVRPRCLLLRARAGQEDPAGQPTGGDCRRRLWCWLALLARCLVWSVRLRVSDLLRLLRLFRHGNRARTDVWVRVRQELRFALQGAKPDRFLAALAYLAF